MKRNKKRVLVAVLAICALAAGGAAFTAAVGGTPSNAIAGFAQTTINGAHATAMQWQLSQDRQYVEGATMTLGADGSNGTTLDAALPATAVVKAGFNVGSTIDWATCTTPTPGTTTAFTCNLKTLTNANGAPVHDATLFNVSVTDGNSN